MTVKCRYTIANGDQGKSKFGQGKIWENQGICFLKLCGHPEYVMKTAQYIPKFYIYTLYNYFP